MKKVDFPWLGDPDIEISHNIPAAETPKKRIWTYCKAYAPAFIAIVLLLTVTFKSKNQKTVTPTQYKSLEVLVSMLPQKKNTLLNPGLLKSIPISANDLSKSDRLILLTKGDLENLPQSIFLSRDLAPRKPITWKDLSNRPSQQLTKPHIFIRGENQP